MYFAQNLHYLRKRDKITQEELAERLGVSRQSVSKWETGEAYPETDKLIALCDLFGVSLDRAIRENIAELSAEETTPVVEAPPVLKEEEPVGEKSVVPYKSDPCARYFNRLSLEVALGAMFVFIGIAAALIFLGAAQAFDDRRLVLVEGLGVCAMFLFDAAASFCFIYAAIKHHRFRKENQRPAGEIPEKTLAKFHRAFAVGVSCLVSAVFLDLIFLIMLTAFIGTNVIAVKDHAAALTYVVAAFFFALAIIAFGIVWFLVQRVKYNLFGCARKEEKAIVKRRNPILHFAESSCCLRPRSFSFSGRWTAVAARRGSPSP